MHEAGASEEEWRAHVQQMISDTPDDMNYETQKVNNSSSLSRGFVKAALNLGCMSQCVYQHGDGHASPDKGKTVDRIMSLFVNPIPLDWSNLNRYDVGMPKKIIFIYIYI